MAEAQAASFDPFAHNDRLVLQTLYELDQCNPLTLGRGSPWFLEWVIIAALRAMVRVDPRDCLSARSLKTGRWMFREGLKAAAPRMGQGAGLSIVENPELHAGCIANLNNLVEFGLAKRREWKQRDAGTGPWRYRLANGDRLSIVCERQSIDQGVEYSEVRVDANGSPVYWRARCGRCGPEFAYAIAPLGRVQGGRLLACGNSSNDGAALRTKMRITDIAEIMAGPAKDTIRRHLRVAKKPVERVGNADFARPDDVVAVLKDKKRYRDAVRRLKTHLDE